MKKSGDKKSAEQLVGYVYELLENLSGSLKNYYIWYSEERIPTFELEKDLRTKVHASICLFLKRMDIDYPKDVFKVPRIADKTDVLSLEIAINLCRKNTGEITNTNLVIETIDLIIKFMKYCYNV